MHHDLIGQQKTTGSEQATTDDELDEITCRIGTTHYTASGFIHQVRPICSACQCRSDGWLPGPPVCESSSGRPVVLTTFTVLADMARQVAGERLEVRSIVKKELKFLDTNPPPVTSSRPPVRT